MLSSAKKSVPTLKQFIQPYFIEIAPNGAVTAACARLGTIDTFSPSRITIPRSLDLSVYKPGSRSFLIRWTPAVKKRSAGARRKLSEKDGLLLADLIKYVSDFIVSTDTKYQIMQRNKAAEKCYRISARHAIGRNFRELISYEYVNSTQAKAECLFIERGYWDGATVYLSPTGKKSYLLCSVRTSGMAGETSSVSWPLIRTSRKTNGRKKGSYASRQQLTMLGRDQHHGYKFPGKAIN
jgi:PAS domain S-box-containing protein